MVTTEEYLAQIAREEAANLRARAEGYESAAHKEAHANTKAGNAGVEGGAAERERQANIRAAQVTDPRTGLPFASASDMEAYANEQSQKVFNPATGKNFTSAADYEIDANRRARLAGYLNAADYESGLRTRSDAPFVDPRDLPSEPIPPQFAIDTANDIKWNPDQPDHVDYDPNWRDNYPSGFDVHGNPITEAVQTNDVKGGDGSIDLLAYRPGSQKYWDTYLPKKSGLLSMNLPPPEYSLAYAPGEFLYPNTYRGVMDAAGDQMRNLPGGKWRYATVGAEGYKKDGTPKQGYGGALNAPGWGTTANPMPWQFTSPAMRTNIARQPWSAKQLNISPAQGEVWQGLLSDLSGEGSTEATSLLGSLPVK